MTRGTQWLRAEEMPGSARFRTGRLLGLGTLLGVLSGLLVAVLATFLDWRLNPGGLFRGDHGTRWGVLAETALSWFLPVAFAAAVAAWVALLWWSSRRAGGWPRGDTRPGVKVSSREGVPRF